jgi:uncharacterized membrane protein
MLAHDKKEIIQTIESLINENRVISFSDSVFAFAATLLILKIDLPTIDPANVGVNLPIALHQLWPSYVANIISFLIIGYYWLNHHAIFSLVKKFDQGIVWLNTLFLLFLSFVPFPVGLFGDYPAEPSVVIFYSASIALVGLLLTSIWLYAAYNKLVDSSLSKRHLKYYLFRLLIAPVVFLMSIPLVLVDPVLSQFSWLLVIVGIIGVNHLFHFKRLSLIEKLSI